MTNGMALKELLNQHSYLLNGLQTIRDGNHSWNNPRKFLQRTPKKAFKPLNNIQTTRDIPQITPRTMAYRGGPRHLAQGRHNLWHFSHSDSQFITWNKRSIKYYSVLPIRSCLSTYFPYYAPCFECLELIIEVVTNGE